MSHGKSCFFIGHREADERLLPRLELTIERLIVKENIRHFYVGGYGGFDRVAAAAVKHAKQKYPDITLIANEIYKVENALKEVDEDYEYQSVSKVTPFTYTDSEGNTIVYYCCQTTYLSNESGEYTGLDMNAIGLVIDISQIENKRECTVNEYDAFLCEQGDRSYLCWTLSPEISCVIEYDAAATSENDILRMAESVFSPVE